MTISGKADPQKEILDLVVSDTGNGITPDIRERLFTDHAISTKVGGTGLGTKIVKDAIDAHRGSIRVESTEGEGTSFHISLPIAQAVQAK